jgi:hypothetical protein
VLVDMSVYLVVELDLDHVAEMVIVQHYKQRNYFVSKRKFFFSSSYSSLIIVEGIGNFCGTFVVIIGDVGVVGIGMNVGISLVVADDVGIHSLVSFVSFIDVSVCDTYRPKSMNDKINIYFLNMIFPTHSKVKMTLN